MINTMMDIWLTIYDTFSTFASVIFREYDFVIFTATPFELMFGSGIILYLTYTFIKWTVGL